MIVVGEEKGCHLVGCIMRGVLRHNVRVRAISSQLLLSIGFQIYGLYLSTGWQPQPTQLNQDILNMILDMSKVESGKIQLEEVQFSMTDVLEESMDMANVVGISRGVEVVWDPCDFSVLRCGAVIGDYKRFKQILDNLLGNAMKFTHEGHVVLRAWANHLIARTSMISTPSRFAPHWCAGSFCQRLLGAREDGAKQNARKSLQNDPNSVEFYFEVVGTGIGIPKEKRESVFENYVQVKEGHGGTGLGLGIVQSFVRLMGGEISLKKKSQEKRERASASMSSSRSARGQRLKTTSSKGGRRRRCSGNPAASRAGTASSSSTATRPGASCRHGWRASG